MYTVNCSKLCFIEHTCCEFVKRGCQTYQHLAVGVPIKPLQAYRDGELTPCNGTIWHPLEWKVQVFVVFSFVRDFSQISKILRELLEHTPGIPFDPPVKRIFSQTVGWGSGVFSRVHFGKTNITMENGRGLKMIFLLKMVIFQPAMLVYQPGNSAIVTFLGWWKSDPKSMAVGDQPSVWGHKGHGLNHLERVWEGMLIFSFKLHSSFWIPICFQPRIVIRCWPPDRPIAAWADKT